MKFVFPESFAYRFRYILDGGSTSSFNCGSPTVDDFFRASAYKLQSIGASCILSLLDTDTWEVVGFVSFSPYLLSKNEKEKMTTPYQIKFPLPAWLIGQLGVDSAYQGKGYGRALLVAAIQEVCRRASDGAGAVIVVDSESTKLVAFYEDVGFVKLRDIGEGKTRLYMTMQEAIGELC